MIEREVVSRDTPHNTSKYFAAWCLAWSPPLWAERLQSNIVKANEDEEACMSCSVQLP